MGNRAVGGTPGASIPTTVLPKEKLLQDEKKKLEEMRESIENQIKPNRQIRRRMRYIAEIIRREALSIRGKKLTRMAIPLSELEKAGVLTPAMVNYLKEYEKRITNKDGKIRDTKMMVRIRTIMAKSKLEKDPIIDFDIHVEPRYSDRHMRKEAKQAEIE
jgi:hypothetical protein